VKAPVCQPAELDFAAEQLSLVMSEGQPVVSDEILTNDGLMLRVFLFCVHFNNKKEVFYFSAYPLKHVIDWHFERICGCWVFSES